MQQSSSLNINWSSVVKLALGVIFLYVVYEIKDILVLFVFGLIIGILFNFVIDALEKRKIPRASAAAFVYLSVFSLLGLFVYKTAPVFLAEIKEFLNNLPAYLGKISPLFEKFGIEAFKSRADFIKAVQLNLEKASENIFNAIFSIFGGAFSTLFIIFMAFFVSLERNLIERLVSVFAPSEYQDYFNDLWRRSRKKVSGWFLSKVIGVIFVGVSTYLVLRILNVKYAPILSLLAGLADFVPIIGPFSAGIVIGAIVAFTSLVQAFFVVAAFILIQLLENNLVLPLLFKKFTGLSPVLILVALAIGAKLWGIWGAILVVPLAGVLYEIFRDYLKKKKEEGDEVL